MYYFFPYYTIDLDKTLIYFMAGRYEFRDKGIDILIKSLGNLNEIMKKDSQERTIVFFIWVPGNVKDIKVEILENRTFFEDINDSVHDVINDLKDRLIYGLVGKKPITDEFLLGKAFLQQTNKRVARLYRDGNPPICTHNLYMENTDEILNSLKSSGLLNRKEDRVKVIFYPVYLTGADQLTDLNYYEAIMACHLGVFPSYYEPWGYTPMETGSLGVASVTTDLSGFGKYLQNIGYDKKNPGIYLLERQNKPETEIVEKLTGIMRDFSLLSKPDRIENKLRAKKLADTADWNSLAENYVKAHNLAIEKTG